MRNIQFDIILAIGIVFVLMGHSHQPSFLFFPAYTFHMGLFFFVSGYFFKPQDSLADKMTFFIKKTKTQLVPYIALLFLFGILTQVLRHFGLNLGIEMNSNSLFWGVFARADEFNLYLSGWFLLTLYFVNITAGLVFLVNPRFNGFVFLASAGLLYYLLELGKNNWGDWHLEIIRSGFGLFFFGFGYFFKCYESKFKPLLLKSVSLATLFLLVNILNVHYGNLGYSILLGNIGNDLVWVPVLSTMAIILIVYVLAHFLALITPQNSILLLVGRHTFSIMVWHLSGFLVLNLIFLAIGWVRLDQLSDVYFRYQVEKTWMLYLAFGLFMPIFITHVYRQLKKIILNRLIGISLAT